MLATLAAAAVILNSPATFETPEAKNKRMAWWREARFGMFIHWGLYAQAAGTWDGKKYGGGVEWIMNFAKVPVKDYEPLLKQFNPVKFDAKEWVSIAKNAGMKYIVITSKHHDGFALWDSKVSDYDIMATPYKKDILKALAEECRKQGMKLGFYHSIMDWHHPDYGLRRPWDPRPEAGKPDMDKYVAYMKGQLKELLTNYGDVATVWFDGEWEEPWNHERGMDLYKYVMALQPKTIVNNRVDKGRSGMAGMTQGDHAGDYGTPEQEIPGKGIPGVDWESCMTMNGTWGYSAHDLNWKSSETLIKNLVDIASKGGNYLLNVGPTGEGLIPDASVERLRDMGAWLKVNGRAIYKTTASPFARSAYKWTQSKGVLYCHVLVWNPGSIQLPGIRTRIESISLLTPTGEKKLEFTQNADTVTTLLPSSAPTQVGGVLALKYKGTLDVTQTAIRSGSDGTYTLNPSNGDVNGSNLRQEESWFGFWTNNNDKIVWDIELPAGVSYDVVVEYACEPGNGGVLNISIDSASMNTKIESTGSWRTFTKVKSGMIALPKGKYRLIASAKEMNQALCNLKSIRLVPQR